MKKNFNKNFKRNDTRENIDLKSQFKKVDTGIKNGVFIFSSPLTVDEFSKKIDKNVSDILKYFFLKGKMLNLNSVLSEDQIGELCLEFNYDFQKQTAVDETNILENLDIKDDPSKLKPRPPVVTIMGHVDHGKTTLLDYIRKTHVVSGEAGGITQHIGAYQVTYNNKKITFIDTPGHEAFTEMRARGANVTDIVVLIVAADDGIKPQTEEAIDHAKAANVPIMVFINKMDKPNANLDLALSQLSEHGLTCEEWGGQTVTVKGSALKGIGVSDLLENILLLAEMNEYKANPDRLANGVVIESKLDKGLGPVATVLVQNGSLAKGDYIVIGGVYGRIRIMLDENNKEVKVALPSTPVKVVGINDVPAAGDHFVVSINERDIKDIANKIKLHEKMKQFQFNQEELKDSEGKKVLNVILKTDVHGSLEAIKGMISKISVPGTKLSIIRSAVGGISESDIQLAKASNAIIVGFNVKPTRSIKDIADSQKISIYFYDIIYKLKESLEKMLSGSLDPIYVEQETGEAEVKQVWHHSQVGTIIGCLVLNGEINRNDKARVLRDGVVVYKTGIASMKHVKDVVTKVTAGMECGIVLDKYNDLKVGDIIQTYKVVTKNIGE